MSTDVDPAITAAAIAALTSLGGVAATWRIAKRTNKLDETKVNQAVYDQAVKLYEGQLTQLDKWIDRLNTQVSGLSSELNAERTISAGLKERIRSLELTVEMLNQTIRTLRGDDTPQETPV